MDVKLEVASGAKSGLLIPVVGEKFLIGRADDCQLKPRSELVSRYHCAILSGEGYVGVRDLGSKNGVFLNGNRVTTETEITNGDRLTVGPLEFIVRTTIEAKTPNKPKVESITDAAVRTVEASSAADGEQQVASWIVGHGDNVPSQDQETITVMYSSADEPKSEMPSAESPTAAVPPSGTHGGSAAAGGVTSRDAAADMLKKFFKGGR